MAAHELIIERAAQKRFLKLPLHVHERIISALEHISEAPLSGIKLHGELGKYYKFRVGDYRVVYSYDLKKKLITVVKIEHRQGVYR